MASWAELGYGCANCGCELDPREGSVRRPVPRRGGRNLPVCPECADEIDAQTTLAQEVEGYAKGASA